MGRLTRRQRVAAAVLAVLALCLLTLDLGGSGLRGAHSGVRGSLGALYRGTDSVLGPVRRFVQGVPHAGSAEDRIHGLQRENAALSKQLADARVDAATARRLAALRLAAAGGGYRVLPARVIAVTPAGGFDWTVTLDVGTARGVRDGQTVTDGNGLVGRVLHADTSTASVLLATDPGSGVGARDLRDGELGVATGAGSAGLSFRPLNPRAALRVGDTLRTGPAGASSYVPGLAIGTVRSVRVSTDGSTLATLTPAVSPTTLDLVGVIVAARGGGAAGTTPLAGGR